MTMKITVNASEKTGKINKNIYGQFAEHLGRCIYGGLYVGEDSDIPNTKGIRNDVLEALKELDIPVLRWPGGCFADDYHWRDGIGPKDSRPYMVNTNWGGVVEDNSFGTHEFMDLCELLGTEPYINGNVGTGTVRELRDWIEYMTFDGNSPLADERRKNGREKPWKVKYIAAGNEMWGCGGNMRPQHYADVFRNYATFMRSYGNNKLFKIASGANEDDTEWTDVMMDRAGHAFDGLTLHYYTMPGDCKNRGDSVCFNESEWKKTMAAAYKMDEIITMHEAVMDKHDPEKKIDLMVDEWGTWFDVMPGTNPGFLYQQNTLRDAVSGMLTLHIFHKHCGRVRMANIAQMVNVLQAMILTEGDEMVLTPTYHLFKMMKPHMDADKLALEYCCKKTGADDVESVYPKISASASERNGSVSISLCNTSLDSAEDMEIRIEGFEARTVSAEVMTADDMRAHNTFDAPDTVKPEKAEITAENGALRFVLPAKSVMMITLA